MQDRLAVKADQRNIARAQARLLQQRLHRFGMGLGQRAARRRGWHTARARPRRRRAPRPVPRAASRAFRRRKAASAPGRARPRPRHRSPPARHRCRPARCRSSSPMTFRISAIRATAPGPSQFESTYHARRAAQFPIRIPPHLRGARRLLRLLRAGGSRRAVREGARHRLYRLRLHGAEPCMSATSCS